MTRRRMEEELERDIADHTAMETEDNIARGMSPQEAHYAALRKFGNVARVKEETRSVWRWASLDTLAADVRHALRRVRRSPGVAALAVLSLALAFAPSVTMFSVMDRLFLTAPGVRNPREIVEIEFRDTRADLRRPMQRVSYPDFQDFQRSLKSFSGLAYQYGKGTMVAVDGRTVVAGAHLVNPDYFSALGIPIEAGPGLSPNRAGLVVSRSFWKRELEGRPDAIGRTLLIYGQAFTVDGIAPADFHGLEDLLPVDLWIPMETWLRLLPAFRGEIDRRGISQGTLWARVRPGVPPGRAAAEVEAVSRDLSQRFPATNQYLTGILYDALGAREHGNRTLTAIGVFLFGILLAVACANVAGILLARAEERRHETAIRQALGASRGRLIREWMIESALLSLLAAAAGLSGAWILMNRLPGWLPSLPIPVHFEFSFGPRVWFYAATLVCASALLFGILPAWRGSRPDLLSGLRRDTAIRVLRVRIPIRGLLIVAQIAAAEILLFSAGLALDTLATARHLDAGFDPHRPVALASMAAAPAEGGAPRDFDCDALRDRLASIAGVRRVVYGRTVPLSGDGAGKTLKWEAPGREPREIMAGSAGPGFLSTLGVRILSGRDLEAYDRNGVLVNASLARQIDPAGIAVGRQIRLGGDIQQVVGVFQDTAWSSVYETPKPRAIGLTPSHEGEVTFAIEVNGDPAAYLPALRAELMAGEPGSIVLSTKTLWQNYRDSLFVENTITQLFYGLGLLALLLTAAGLHGVASALFNRRSKEFAIRIALGAAPRQIMGAVFSSSLKLTACGLALGLAIAYPVALMVASKLPGFSRWSLAALALSSAIVMAAAIAAAAQPARRVLRIQPADIVRSE